MTGQRKFFHCGLVMLASLFGVTGLTCTAHAAANAEAADTIRIMMNKPADSEMPAALFDHKLHASKMAPNGLKDCVVCHKGLADQPLKADPFRVVPAKLKGDKLMDAWHATCMDCHDKQDAGPAASSCHSCHDAKAAPAVTSKVEFGRGLHAAHINSKHIAPVLPEVIAAPVVGLQNCGACHTSTNAEGKTVYVKDTEDAFSFYHVETKDGAVLSGIAHDTCISCHIDTMRSSVNAANLKLPVQCADCHSAEAQAKFPADKDAPRLVRGQADTMVLGTKAEKKSLSSSPEAALKPVSFDHRAHEDVASCGTCHGQKIEKKEALSMAREGLSAYAAAHDASSATSCVGCHAKTIAEDKNCAGCHADLKFQVKDSCAVCHNAAEPKAEDNPLLAFPTQRGNAPIDPKDVPEKVTIGALSNEYEAAELPHRKIYQALLDGMKDDKLATAFHVESVCKACHHQLPNDNIANPPSCSSCHDKEVKAMTVDQTPNLKAAYHQMCISCHANMDVKPAASECTDCHAKKSANTKKEVR